jgi:lysophospholipid acyltransferase
LLTLPASFLVWARVYFYAVIGTALSTAFFASPAKAFLIKKLNERAGTSGPLKRKQSQESLANKEPVLGLPPEPQKDLEELVSEVKAEMEARQRRGTRRAEITPVPEKKAI